MELKEFITKTLEDIAQGVNDASATYEKLNGEINPMISGIRGECDVRVSNVEFEICLTDTSTKEANASLGVALSIIKGGGDKSNSTLLSSLTKVKFNVPVNLPRLAHRRY